MRKAVVAMALLTAACSSADSVSNPPSTYTNTPVATVAQSHQIELPDQGGFCHSEPDLCRHEPFRLRVVNLSRPGHGLQSAASPDQALTVYAGDRLYYQVATANTSPSAMVQIGVSLRLADKMTFGLDPSLRDVNKAISYVPSGSFHHFAVIVQLDRELTTGDLMPVLARFSWPQGQAFAEAWVRVGEAPIVTASQPLDLSQCPGFDDC